MTSGGSRPQPPVDRRPVGGALGCPRGFCPNRVRARRRDPRRHDGHRRRLADDPDADPRVRDHPGHRDRIRPRLRGRHEDRGRLQALAPAHGRHAAVELDGDRLRARRDLRRVGARAGRGRGRPRLRRPAAYRARRRPAADRRGHAGARVPEEHARPRARHDRDGAPPQDRGRGSRRQRRLRPRHHLGRQRSFDRRRPDPAVPAHAHARGRHRRLPRRHPAVGGRASRT